MPRLPGMPVGYVTVARAAKDPNLLGRGDVLPSGDVAPVLLSKFDELFVRKA
jgi:hypothetical protein